MRIQYTNTGVSKSADLLVCQRLLVDPKDLDNRLYLRTELLTFVIHLTATNIRTLSAVSQSLPITGSSYVIFCFDKYMQISPMYGWTSD